MLFRRVVSASALSIILLLSSGCKKDEDAGRDGDPVAQGVTPPSEVRELETMARAVIEPLGDSRLSGSVTFGPTDLGVQVSYVLNGLGLGRYGLHVHEQETCADGVDGSPGGAAGAHFNPDGSPHGAPNLGAGQRHVGDLGNVHVLSEGVVVGSFNATLIAFEGPNSILGKALVIHSGEDDFTTQPAGNSGGRIGCGIITQAEVS